MRYNAEAERDFWRERCYSSFWWFFRYAWGYDFNPKGAAGGRPWLDESTHKPACDWFQDHVLAWLKQRREGKAGQLKLIIVVPRDWGKTTLFTQAGQAWLHIHDPEIASYTGCETVTRAREVLDGIKAVISGDDRYSRFSWLYGGQRRADRVWKQDFIVTAARTNLTRRDASFGTWAVESGLVGLHPDGCFFDDPNTYEQMKRKHDWLLRVNQHLDSLIPVFQSDAIWCLTGTRYGDNDHIGRTIHNEGALTVSGMAMPNVTPSKDGLWHVFFMDAEDDQYPDYDGRHYVMPKIWSPMRINSFKKRNMVRYYAQIRNNPTQSPHNLINKEFCNTLIRPRDGIDFKKLRVSLHLDTAFKRIDRKTQGDLNVIGAVGHMMDGSGRCIYLGASAGLDWDSNALGKNLIQDVKHYRAMVHRIACITDEEEIGGKPGIWEAWISNLFQTAKVPQPEIKILNRGAKDKDERLREAAAMWLDGRMLLLEGAPGLDELVDQMCKIGMTAHNDYADAIADCFHRDVYRSIYLAETAIKSEQINPFDEILKPGPAGTHAANQIADSFHQEEPVEWHVVKP